MTCVSTCVHVDIEDWMIEIAEDQERQIKAQKGINNPTTLELNKRMDFLGALAQNGVVWKAQDYGVQLEDTPPFFNPDKHNDEYDYLCRGLRCDVQGQPLGSFRDGKTLQVVYPNTHFLISNRKQGRQIDSMTFVAIDLPRRVLHIAGVIPFSEVWKTPYSAPGLKAPCHMVLAKQLRNFRQFIFGVL